MSSEKNGCISKRKIVYYFSCIVNYFFKRSVCCFMQIRIGRFISILYRKNQIFLSSVLKPLGLSASEYPILLVLYDDDGLTQEDLTSRLHLDKSAVARAIHSLEEKGFIHKEKDAADQRCNRISLMPRSLEVRPRIMEALDQWNEILMSGMNAEERDAAYQVLIRMTDNVKRR